jgi:hypothetical protein
LATRFVAVYEAGGHRMITLEGVTSDKVLAMPLLAEGGQQIADWATKTSV